MNRRKLERASLDQHVYQLLKQDILDGRLVPGDPLVEARLAEEFGISKTPVREALIRLEFDGLVQIERYRGAHVSTPSLDDVKQICELRRWIEGGIAASVAESPPPEIVRELQQNVETARRALVEHDQHLYLEAIRAFDAILAKGTGNQYATRILTDLYNILALIGAASLQVSGRREKSIDEHVHIVEAIAAGDPAAATAATIAHISSVEGDFRVGLRETMTRARATKTSDGPAR